MRKILAVLLGAAVSVALITVFQIVGHKLHPLPADTDFSDPQVLDRIMFEVPPEALMLVVFSYIAGTIGGGLVAALIARSSSYVYTAIIGTLMTVGTVINVMTIPHPLWFSVTAITAIIACIFLTSRLAEMLLGRAEPVSGQ